MSARYNYIAIEGNIGAGKTSLATRLAADFNARLILEQFEENSFLPRFYQDPARYAFPLELSFLADRYQQMKNHFAVTDLFHPRTVSDYFIQKSMIFASRTLESNEFALYSRFFSIVSSVIPRPDLLVYLYLDTANLKKNIEKRGRPYELSISEEYLEKIQSGYMDFLKQQREMRIVMVETSGMDFVEREEDYMKLKEIAQGDYAFGVTVL